MAGEGHVAIYLPGLGPGGVSRYGQNLAQVLMDGGFRCSFVLDRPGDAPPPGTELHVLPRAGLATRLLDLRTFLRNSGVDVIVSNGWFADLLVAIATAGLRQRPRKVSVTHIRPVLWTVRPTSAPMRWAKNLLARWAYNRADLRIAVSRGLAEELNRGGWSNKPFVPLYSPIPDFGLPSGGLRRDAGQPVRIAAVGWLLPHKGFDTLLEAFARLEVGRLATLTIVGGASENDPAYPAQLKQLAHRLGIEDRVTFAGQVADPTEVLRASDLFAFPSRCETFGLALVEAMAVGLPVIAADCAHGPTEILDGGRYGILIQPDDPAALADALAALIEDPGRAWEMGERAREGAARFSPENTGEPYIRSLRSLLGAERMKD